MIRNYFGKRTLVSLALLVLVLCGFFFVLAFAEERKGFVIEKGWLDGIAAPADYSAWIFTLTYAAALCGIVISFRRPQYFLLLVRAYMFLTLFRAVLILLVPLDPPEGIVPLHDPFLQATFYDGRPNLKDLFFSGHAATVFLFFLLARKIPAKIFFLLLSCIIGILVVLQRVHYMADVAAAPLFAWAAFRISSFWASKESTSPKSSTTIS